MSEQLQRVAKVVAYLRRGLGGWKARERKAKAAYQETPEYQLYAEIVKVRTYVQGLLKAVEASLRGLVLVAFARDGNKKPAPGLGVRVSKGKATVVYADPAAATRWLFENAPAALMRNEAVVLGLIEAGKEIPGARVVNEGAGGLTATIASKLTELYLKED